jgi:hypothetical protein
MSHVLQILDTAPAAEPISQQLAIEELYRQ